MSSLQHSCVFIACVAVVLAAVGAAADDFGVGADRITLDFTTIDPGPAAAAEAFRIGVCEITNRQWDSFLAASGRPRGCPSYAYLHESYFIGDDIPVTGVSWYEAAQFVNWLNTSTGHAPAYCFAGPALTDGYAPAVWPADVACDPASPYRHRDAFYYLPTDKQWTLAAYWNGTDLQPYATTPGDSVSPEGWNYNACGLQAPWPVASGRRELNGTYDMMGNVWEWLENPTAARTCAAQSWRGIAGGSYFYGSDCFLSSGRYDNTPHYESMNIGFRVASAVPEPACVLLMGVGAALLTRGRRYR